MALGMKMFISSTPLCAFFPVLEKRETKARARDARANRETGF